jgi:hypothetical protein
MLAQLTSGKKMILPAGIIRKLPGTRVFDADVRDGVLTLRPVADKISTSSVQAKMRRLGLKMESVTEAIEWARKQ